MLPVSVCIIAKNEEKHIEECLKRLRPCQFEIVVVDTGSTDRTIEIAREYTDKIFTHEWTNDFSEARNYAVSKASNDWVIMFDCDEYLEKINVMELEKLVLDEANVDKIGVITRNNPYAIQGVLSIISEKIGRMYNRNYCHYEGLIHEQVKTMDGAEAKRFDVPVTSYHEGYVGKSDVRLRATRNIEMLLASLAFNEGDPYIYYQLGQNYMFLRDFEKAAENYRLSLHYNSNADDPLVQSIAEAYGFCMIELERYDELIALKDEFFRFEKRADFVFLKGTLFTKLHLYDEAIQAFLTATTLKDYSRRGVNSYRAYYNIAQIYEELGNKEKAAEYYHMCGDYELAAEKHARLETL